MNAKEGIVLDLPSVRQLMDEHRARLSILPAGRILEFHRIVERIVQVRQNGLPD